MSMNSEAYERVERVGKAFASWIYPTILTLVGSVVGWQYSHNQSQMMREIEANTERSVGNEKSVIRIEANRFTQADAAKERSINIAGFSDIQDSINTLTQAQTDQLANLSSDVRSLKEKLDRVYDDVTELKKAPR